MRAGCGVVVRIASSDDFSSHQLVSSPYWLNAGDFDRFRIASHCAGLAAASSLTRVGSAIGLKCRSEAIRNLLLEERCGVAKALVETIATTSNHRRAVLPSAARYAPLPELVLCIEASRNRAGHLRRLSRCQRHFTTRRAVLA